MRATCLFLASALALGAGAALAQTATGFWPVEADTDNDDMISRDEAMVLAHKVFDRYDYDGSNDISMQEWRLIIEDRVANARQQNPNVVAPSDMDAFTSATFKTHDSDGDDAISRSEWDARVADHFARLDSNGDGMLVREEATTAIGPDQN